MKNVNYEVTIKKLYHHPQGIDLIDRLVKRCNAPFEIDSEKTPRTETERLFSMMKDMQQDIRRAYTSPTKLSVPKHWTKNPAHSHYIVSIPQGSSVPGCEETGECYIPSNLKIPLNQTVTWSNDDTAAHTVTSGSSADGPDTKFDSSLFMSGQTFSHTFSEKGTFPYFCMVHPWQTGTIIVE